MAIILLHVKVRYVVFAVRRVCPSVCHIAAVCHSG